jgi:hypothetical protein
MTKFDFTLKLKQSVVACHFVKPFCPAVVRNTSYDEDQKEIVHSTILYEAIFSFLTLKNNEDVNVITCSSFLQLGLWFFITMFTKRIVSLESKT